MFVHPLDMMFHGVILTDALDCGLWLLVLDALLWFYAGRERLLPVLQGVVGRERWRLLIECSLGLWFGSRCHWQIAGVCWSKCGIAVLLSGGPASRLNLASTCLYKLSG